ncbi:ATPase V1 complex subunit H [Pisolithus croceorrhizus]|nr:ATPase V1 complex subunit H [Pisolithus croceorrhizus]
MSASLVSKPVPWEIRTSSGIPTRGTVTTEELGLIKKTESILVSDGQTYALLYLRLLKKLQRVDTCNHDERIPLFTRTIFYHIDRFYSAESTPLQHHHLQPFLRALATLVQSTSANKRSLLARPECRKAVWAIPGIIAGLVEILRHKPGPQILTFWQEIRHIPLLTSVAEEAAKEKVTRVIIATFRNLVTKAPSANLPAMVSELLPFTKNLAAAKWSDEDILEDIQFVRDELDRNFASLTTYDVYTSELASNHLTWTPVHESEEFWPLIQLLDSSDPVTLAVAVHDVGQYVKHCERGKKVRNLQVVTDLGAKARAMELMTHSDPDVRYHALLAVQELVSHPWTAA